MNDDPNLLRPTTAQLREGVWVCTQCDCVNDPDDSECWNCGWKNDNVPLNEDSERE